MNCESPKDILLCHAVAMQAAERHLRSSGLKYTIVRPGGLSNDPPSAKGNLFVSREDTLFGLESDPGRAISRDTVGVSMMNSNSLNIVALVMIVFAVGMQCGMFV
eukprot:GHUV01025175.1.p1 GENE.GHUV01025175.1~~GHUV01025175.1.p1  ORF type:complete len:105 (-),score=14.04 GHUV01025175.1:104-418(-)